MIIHPGEYHDATSDIPIPQSLRTLEIIERGRRMPPLAIQVALREARLARVTPLPDRWHIPDAEAA
ncbi:hypothetical protein [Arthrobacter sedimenti]|uniref:hypothetical protein n=1 Tax=Arthrobacter sedimenti TaxID=2694931 RepID=UPI000B352630|nr:hypothetical protein [Arthrobacter sedimenti]OUM42505.1 hypothetical protein B8W73_06550 [Arthrobacter agilis]